MTTRSNHDAFLVGAILIAALHSAHGQFPMACKDNITERIGVCCPNPNGHINACGYPDRGICEELPQTNVNFYPRVADDIQDDRFNWPHAYVQKGCRCYGNFYGPDCSECMWGWSGSRCDVKDVPRARRNIMDYNWREKRIFRDTLQRAKEIPSGLGAVLPPANFSTDEIRMEELSIYDMYIWFHYRTSHQPLGACSNRPSYNFAHQGPHFGIWHRLYMLWIEKRLRSVSEDHHFMLPYWDWIDAENCTVCTNDLVGANNDTDPNGWLETESPFYSWDTRCPRVENNTAGICGLCDPTISSGKIQRNFPVLRRNVTYPSADRVRVTLERRQFNLYDPLSGIPNPIFPDDFIIIPRDFTGALENVHGIVHIIQSGTMGSVMISPNDPMFILHHTMVDKLLEVWFKRFGVDKNQYPYSSYPMGQNAEEPMVPLYPQEQIIDYFKYGDDLGYKYDTLCLSYENETECPRQTEVPTTATPTSPSTTSNPTTSTTPATTTTTSTSATSTTTTTTVPTPPADVVGDDTDLWKGLAISSFAISIILLVMFGVALIMSLVQMRRTDPYIVKEHEAVVHENDAVKSEHNGIANPSLEVNIEPTIK